MSVAPKSPFTVEQTGDGRWQCMYNLGHCRLPIGAAFHHRGDAQNVCNHARRSAHPVVEAHLHDEDHPDQHFDLYNEAVADRLEQILLADEERPRCA